MEREQIGYMILTGLANKYILVLVIAERLSSSVCQLKAEARATLWGGILKTVQLPLTKAFEAFMKQDHFHLIFYKLHFA